MFFQSQAFLNEKSQILSGFFWSPKETKGVQRSQNFTSGFKKAKFIGNPATKYLQRKKYKTYRNKLTHLKEISKQNYYKQAFQKCHHDIKNHGSLSMK